MRKRKIEAKILNLHQAHEIIKEDFKDKDGVVVTKGGQVVKIHRKGPAIAETFHVQVGVIVDGSLKYSIHDEAKKNPTSVQINALLKKASNEYKATLQAAGETVPDIDLVLET